MEKFTPLAKILHCRRHWRDGQIPPLIKIFNFEKQKSIFKVILIRINQNDRKTWECGISSTKSSRVTVAIIFIGKGSLSNWKERCSDFAQFKRVWKSSKVIIKNETNLPGDERLEQTPAKVHSSSLAPFKRFWWNSSNYFKFFSMFQIIFVSKFPSREKV